MNKINFTLIMLLITAFAPCLSAQNYLSKERENEIKTSGKYYWSECSDFKEYEARQCALDEFYRVVEDAVNQTSRQDETLNAIKTSVRFDRLQQQGKNKILAWVAKDSVFITAKKPTTQQVKSIEEEEEVIWQGMQTNKIQVDTVEEEEEEIVWQPTQPVSQPQPKAVSEPEQKLDPVLSELVACKDYNCVRRVAITKGLVRGSKLNSSEGFSNPEKCIIAVFTADEKLSALLDAGKGARKDLLTGETIQNPEQYYDLKKYFLWYLQQKN